MKTKIDAIDKKVEDENKKLEEENAKVSGFSKLYPYNTPKYHFFIATFAAAINGSSQPLLGVAFAKVLTLLSTPKDLLVLMNDGNEDYLQEEVTKICLWMVIIAAVCSVGYFTAKFSFGTLGNNVTLKIRQILYAHILEMNIGFFDERDNGPSVLTSIMAADTAVINGIGTESIGPTSESIFGMIIGIGIGFYFCWQEALVCFLVSPIMVIGTTIDMKMMEGEGADNSELEKEANLLCGDAIINYKTVQSFGHEDMLVKKYEELLAPIHKKAMWRGVTSGLAFGYSQFSQYVVFAVMFWAGGAIIKNSEIDEETGELSINPEDIFIALFAIMFGANAAGTAASFGPDAGKAEAAAQKIFRIIETKSTINAIKMDEDVSKK